MANKTIYTSDSVENFIEQIDDLQKRSDSHELIKLMEKTSGKTAAMWGSSIVGFGNYHYKYESGHEGDAPVIGFSPRKAAISLYVFTGLEEHRQLLDDLGKFKMGKACIYVKRLSDINEEALIKIMKATIEFLNEKYSFTN